MKASNVLNRPFVEDGVLKAGSQELGSFGGQKGSNWVLLDRVKVEGEALGTRSVQLDGDQYDRVKVVVSMGTSSTASSVLMRLNNDSGNNYTEVGHGGGTAALSGVATRSYVYMTVSTTNGGIAEAEIFPKVTGTPRQVIATGASSAAAPYNSYIRQQYYTWNNTADKVTSIDFYDSVATGTCTATIEVYAWREAAYTDLVTYELVKEIKFNNEVVNVTLPWDSSDDEFTIVYDNTGPSTVDMLFNGDENSTYTRVSHWAGGTTQHSAGEDTINSMLVGYNSSAGMSRCFLSSTGARVMMDATQTTGGHSYKLDYAFIWNKTDEVTSLKFRSNVATTGWLRVMKPVKTQKLKDGLKLWKKFSFDADEVDLDLDLSALDASELVVQAETSTGSNYLRIGFNGNSETIARRGYVGGTYKNDTVTNVNLPTVDESSIKSVVTIGDQSTVVSQTGMYGSDNADIHMLYKSAVKAETIQIYQNVATETVTGTISIYYM